MILNGPVYNFHIDVSPKHELTSQIQHKLCAANLKTKTRILFAPYNESEFSDNIRIVLEIATTICQKAHNSPCKWAQNQAMPTPIHSHERN